MKKFKKVLKGYMIYSIIVTIIMICTSKEYRKALKNSLISGYRAGRYYFEPWKNPDNYKVTIDLPHFEFK